jgi:hypothetical protein
MFELRSDVGGGKAKECSVVRGPLWYGSWLTQPGDCCCHQCVAARIVDEVPEDLTHQ